MLKHDGPATERVELTLETVEFLRIAAVVATNVRRGSHRKVNIYKPATGETLRQAPLDEYYTGIARTLDITFSLRDDAPQAVCAGWEGPCPKKAKPSRTSFRADSVAARRGDSWRCLSCLARKRVAAQSPDERRALTQKARSALTHDIMVESARRARASMTPSHKITRNERAINAVRSLTLDQRVERVRRANEANATRRAKAGKKDGAE